MPLKGTISSSERVGLLTTATLGLSDAITEAGKEMAQHKERRLHDGMTTTRAGAGTTRNGTIAVRRETIKSVASRPHFGCLEVSGGAWRCLEVPTSG